MNMEMNVITEQDEITECGDSPCDIIAMEAAETIDAFIFKIVLPFCSETERRIITKAELIEALTLLREKRARRDQG